MAAVGVCTQILSLIASSRQVTCLRQCLVTIPRTAMNILLAATHRHPWIAGTLPTIILRRADLSLLLETFILLLVATYMMIGCVVLLPLLLAMMLGLVSILRMVLATHLVATPLRLVIMIVMTEGLLPRATDMLPILRL